jgi:hypothetical protein
VGWEPLRHYDFMDTTPVVPVLFVVPLTILRNGRANAASGSEYTVPTVLEGVSVTSAAEPSLPYTR